MRASRDIIANTKHRPWRLPDGRWVLSQSWCDLLFAHWRVAKRDLPVPPVLEVEEFDGSAWVGVVPFRMEGFGPRWVPPLPGLSRFLELNVRTYVRFDGKPGVYFFSLDASSRLAVAGARATYRLPYFPARVSFARDGASSVFRSSRRGGTKADFEGTYRGTGESFVAAGGSLEHFLVERYCLYTTTDDGGVLRADIHHGPWLLREASATITSNTMMEAAGIRTTDSAPLFHIAARQDVLTWPPHRADAPRRRA